MKDQAIQIIRVAAMIYIVIYHCVCYYGIWQDQFPTNTIYESIDEERAILHLMPLFLSPDIFMHHFITRGNIIIQEI